MSFKVIEVCINRKPVCDFLLVNRLILTESYLVPFRSYRSLLFKFWTLRFWAPFGGLETTYDVHLELIGKRVEDFLLVLIELLTRCYSSAGALLAKIDRKSALSLQRGQFDPKFLAEVDVPRQSFLQIVRPMNALQFCRWQFLHKETL